MGGAASHFAETNWETADGGLKEASETFDGAKPVEEHSIFHIKKKNVVNQRECELRDEDDVLHYSTIATPGTTKDLDVLDKDGNKLYHVSTDHTRSKWEIYSYKSNFEGQTTAEKGELKVEDPLYHKACVTIAWDKYHGVVSVYQQSQEDTKGMLSKEPLIKVEEIKSITPQFQSFIPKQIPSLHTTLVGYWVREKTAKMDRIKMHLAKGTDIALHTILAVITNLVQVERNSESCA
jgi:hypothetical protein